MPMRQPRILNINNFAKKKVSSNRHRNIKNFFTNSRWTKLNSPYPRWTRVVYNSAGYSNINKLGHISNILMKKARHSKGYDLVFYVKLSDYLYDMYVGNKQNNNNYNAMLHERIMSRNRTPSRSPPKRPRRN